MNQHKDAWDGLPAEGAEMKLADFLDKALDHMARGESVVAAELLDNSPELIEEGQRLLQDLRALVNPAAGLAEQSQQLQCDLLDESALSDSSEGSNPIQLPDPFPGQFRVIGRLGAGAFGTVWLAEDIALDRNVALKTVRVGSGSREATRLQCLREEARLLATVRHRNVVTVHAWRESASGEHYLVLQYVPGGSLAERVMDEGPLSWNLAARYVADVADGLVAMHACGIVHRDVKPANILWHRDLDEAMLTDFGVSARLSSRGSMAGTLPYMPPEAFAGIVSPAQDVYALGATLFWLVTGSVPFAALTPTTAALVIQCGLPDPDPRCARLPASLEKTVRDALSADPARRPSLLEFTRTLRGALNRSLADSLLLPITTGSARVNLTVHRRVANGAFVPLTTTQPVTERLVRDLRTVPPEPKRVEVRTGERLRIEAETDRDGYLAVFNIGPTGNLNLLAPATAVRGGRAVQIEVELTEPSGRERLCALWTREPLALRVEELRQVGERGEMPTTEGCRSTRDMARVQESIHDLAPDGWGAAVLGLDHLAVDA